MFERFEEDAVRAILAARDEACKLGHRAVGLEHLVVGLARTNTPIADLIRAQGPSMETLDEALKTLLGHVEGATSTDIPFSVEAQQAIARSWAIAEEYHHGTIAPAHFLFAVLGRAPEDSGIASLLLAAGVDPHELVCALKGALAPVAKPRVRAGFQEDDLECPTPYGPVTLTLIRRPQGTRDSARVISLSADTLSGPEEVRSFLSELDRLLDSSAGGLGVAFLRDLFGGLGSRLAAYLKPATSLPDRPGTP